MDTDAVRKAPNGNSARMGAKLQLLFVSGTIAGVGGFGYAVDGPPVGERVLALLTLLMVVGGIAMIAGLVGLILICDALVRDRYRAPWLFWFLIVYGPLLLFILPWGTPFGIFFIIYALMKATVLSAGHEPLPRRLNHAMELTASRRTTLSYMSSTISPEAKPALARSSSSCFR